MDTTETNASDALTDTLLQTSQVHNYSPNMYSLTTGQPLICSQLIGNQCTVATCGCNPTVAYGACYGQCQPLGTCNDATGTCQCNTGYAGDHCEICAEGNLNIQRKFIVRRIHRL